MRNLSLLVLLAIGGCRAAAPASPRPDTATDQWRQLVGCYQIDGHPFSLDSVPGTRFPSPPEPGIRRARFEFVPFPRSGHGYWFVTPQGRVWVVSREGWGVTYELVQRGDSLVGKTHLHSHVVGAQFSPTPVGAVRATGCPAEALPATPVQP